MKLLLETTIKSKSEMHDFGTQLAKLFSISDVITVANKNLTMPPKSTWFDPKPLDGLVVYEFEK